MTCGVCEQLVDENEWAEAYLYINGNPAGLTGSVHARDGKPVHPESLSGVGGPLVGENDTWEWRVER
jgi:hypothetical protein